MKAAAVLREKIASDAVVAGVLVTNHLWVGLVELLHRAGMDYMIVDQEHGAYSDELVADVCAVGRLIDFPVIIRTIDSSYSCVRQAIDRGPCGLLLPGTESTAQLDEVRDAIWMPPRGRRRPGGPGNRWPTSFNYANWKAEVEDHFVVMPQIETRKGLEHVDAIAGHEITTAIAIGPYDLSADLGCCWDPTHPDLQAAIKRIRDAGRDAGKNMWHIGHAPDLIAAGFNFICVSEPTGTLEATLKTMVSDTRALAAGDASASAADASDEPLP